MLYNSWDSNFAKLPLYPHFLSTPVNIYVELEFVILNSKLVLS